MSTLVLYFYKFGGLKKQIKSRMVKFDRADAKKYFDFQSLV